MWSNGWKGVFLFPSGCLSLWTWCAFLPFLSDPVSSRSLMDDGWHWRRQHVRACVWHRRRWECVRLKAVRLHVNVTWIRIQDPEPNRALAAHVGPCWSGELVCSYTEVCGRWRWYSGAWVTHLGLQLNQWVNKWGEHHHFTQQPKLLKPHHYRSLAFLSSSYGSFIRGSRNHWARLCAHSLMDGWVAGESMTGWKRAAEDVRHTHPHVGITLSVLLLKTYKAKSENMSGVK